MSNMNQRELSTHEGDNRYVVVAVQRGFVQLECVWFCAKEDLGDGIFCTEENQKIWVATYHADYMLHH